MTDCYHCGEPCFDTLVFEDKNFCCTGCRTVFEIFKDNGLEKYYSLEKSPGISPQIESAKFNFLENSSVVDQLLEFDQGGVQIVSFLIPSIHCSSCIWILENLRKLNPAVKSSQVNFPKKQLRISYSSDNTSLKEIVILLARIGYEPVISLENSEKKIKKYDRGLIYKLGVAGFAFGNVMLLSFPEYFEVQEFWLERFKHLFRWLMFAYSIPVVFYASSGYFNSAYKGLRSGLLNIDLPIAIGITVLFLRSTVDIIFDWGSGFFDSLTGLIFFLLLGKFFQQKTYSYLSFERDYKSYFPIAVTKLIEDKNGVVT
ncbi:MAG: heavy metal translocating P-type ATPase metal-binding domain-containing protein, partial [Flavobacteriaceae bacterium]|nr:heavy metal translocating P-type ATPase metal-binding domain-containing protein [Flavobacteriaceae bacterium]